MPEALPAEAPALGAHDLYAMVAPTPDHFVPLRYLAGLAAAAGEAAEVLIDGYAMGSLSMTCYTLGCEDVGAAGSGGAPPLPRVPLETNI
jgi:4,5-DOPA dioxygenase extradiol